MLAEKVEKVSEHRVFVYGTLRRGECNNGQMRNVGATFVRNDRIRADRFETSFGYPCVLEGLGLVDGEVFSVNDMALLHLDNFEGTPYLYERKKIRSLSGDEVWVYYGKSVQEGIIREQ